MKLSGSHKLPVDPARAYGMLQDPEVLAACMPGCEKLVHAGQDTYEMQMKMVLAALSGQFDGKVRITDQQPPGSFRLTVEGNGRAGFMKGSGVLHLSPIEEGANVSFEGDVQVGGTFAAVGQRLIETTAKMMIKRFFDKLVEKAAAKP